MQPFDALLSEQSTKIFVSEVVPFAFVTKRFSFTLVYLISGTLEEEKNL